ncbi:MAG: FAD-dependent pyridine nucleotide-disulfide oxidoreductase [Gammaproteobacteria bacterium]|nr:FAD-dependent pyridine nucleotide-disulfide oxidoreductase [Gammaproteobacteria bacterium]
MAQSAWDVVIVGAGPAGLSAALVLGRACRRVLVCDRGTPRNRASKAINAFLTRDGISPGEFRRIAHLELHRYPNVARVAAEVTRAARLSDGGFAVRVANRTVTCRKLLIATGVLDRLPNIAGIDRFFGSSVFQCPYCDGWEVRGAPVAAYGKRQRGFEIARALTAWTDDIALCTNGPSGLSRSDKLGLRRNRIRLCEQPILRLRGSDGKLQAIEFTAGEALPRSALFFDTACTDQSQLAASLGCQFNRSGGIRCGQYEATSVPGVFVAGNIIKDVQLSIVAAAEGARAAFGINRSLTREDFSRKASGVRHIEHPTLQIPSGQKRVVANSPSHPR